MHPDAGAGDAGCPAATGTGCGTLSHALVRGERVVAGARRARAHALVRRVGVVAGTGARLRATRLGAGCGRLGTAGLDGVVLRGVVGGRLTRRLGGLLGFLRLACRLGLGLSLGDGLRCRGDGHVRVGRLGGDLGLGLRCRALGAGLRTTRLRGGRLRRRGCGGCCGCGGCRGTLRLQGGTELPCHGGLDTRARSLDELAELLELLECGLAVDAELACDLVYAWFRHCSPSRVPPRQGAGLTG